MPNQIGRKYRYKNMEFWAEGGMIVLVDTEKAGDSKYKEDEYKQLISPGEFLKRAMAVRMCYGDLDPYEARLASRLLENATDACTLAKKQGDLSEVSAGAARIPPASRMRILTPNELYEKISVRYKIARDDPMKILRDGVRLIEEKPSLLL